MINCTFETIKEYLLKYNSVEIEFENTFLARSIKNEFNIDFTGYSKFIIEELAYKYFELLQDKKLIKNLQ